MKKLLSTICVSFMACTMMVSNMLPMSVYAQEAVDEQSEVETASNDEAVSDEDSKQSDESEESEQSESDQSTETDETDSESEKQEAEVSTEQEESDANTSQAKLAATTIQAYVMLDGETLAQALAKDPVDIPLPATLDTTNVPSYTGYVFKKAYVTDGTGDLIKNCSYLFVNFSDNQVYWHYYKNGQTPDNLTGTLLGTDKVVLKYNVVNTGVKHTIEVNVVDDKDSSNAKNKVVSAPDTFNNDEAFEIELQNAIGYSVTVKAGLSKDDMSDTGVTESSHTSTKSVWGIDPSLMSIEKDSTVYVTVTYTKKETIYTGISYQAAPYWHDSDWYVSDQPFNYIDYVAANTTTGAKAAIGLSGSQDDTGTYSTKGTSYPMAYTYLNNDVSATHSTNSILTESIGSTQVAYIGTLYYHNRVNETAVTRDQSKYSLTDPGNQTLYYMLVVPQKTKDDAVYLLDALEINDQMVNVPHVMGYKNNGTSVTTDLETGEKVTVTMQAAILSYDANFGSVGTTEYNTYGLSALTNNWTVYFIQVDNVYEDVDITAGNVRATTWAEVVPTTANGIDLRVLDGTAGGDVTSTSSWKDFGTNEPFAYTSGSAAKSAIAAFKVSYGYSAPVTISVSGIDYTSGKTINEATFTISDLSQLPTSKSSTSEDLIDSGVITLVSGDADNSKRFYLYNDANGTMAGNGYTIVEIPGFTSSGSYINYVTLDISASSKEYRVKYDTTTLLKALGGEASGGPAEDLTTYKTADNPTVTLSKVIPKDVSGKNYVFKDWIVFPKGDTTQTTGARRLPAGYTINNQLALQVMANYTDDDGNITLYAEWELDDDSDLTNYSSYTIKAYVQDDNPTTTDTTVTKNGKTYKLINDSLVEKGYLSNQQRMMPNSTLVKFMDKLENYLNNSKNGFISDSATESYELDEDLSNTEITVEASSANNEIALYYNLVSDTTDVPTGSILPDLGGMGTQMFMISGTVLMIFAILLIKKKNKSSIHSIKHK